MSDKQKLKCETPSKGQVNYRKKQRVEMNRINRLNAKKEAKKLLEEGK